MPSWANSDYPKIAGLALCIAGMTILTLLIVRQYLRSRVSAEEQERRRLNALDRAGKVGDGEIIEFEGDNLVYSWHVAGVVYTGVQETKALKGRLPEDLMSTIGPVSVKFDPRNPANSMIISERWSGFRFQTAGQQVSDRP